jgi:hypothetical protein
LSISFKYKWKTSIAAAIAGEPKPCVIRENLDNDRWTDESRVGGIVGIWWWEISDELELWREFDGIPLGGDATFTGDRSCLSTSLNSWTNCLKNSSDK